MCTGETRGIICHSVASVGLCRFIPHDGCRQKQSLRWLRHFACEVPGLKMKSPAPDAQRACAQLQPQSHLRSIAPTENSAGSCEGETSHSFREQNCSIYRTGDGPCVIFFLSRVLCWICPQRGRVFRTPPSEVRPPGALSTGATISALKSKSDV